MCFFSLFDTLVIHVRFKALSTTSCQSVSITLLERCGQIDLMWFKHLLSTLYNIVLVFICCSSLFAKEKQRLTAVLTDASSEITTFLTDQKWFKQVFESATRWNSDTFAELMRGDASHILVS